MRARGEAGFTMVELLVASTIFAAIATVFMSVMFSVARGTESTTDSVRISEEARLGLNRMVRDTREAAWIELSSTNPDVTHDSFTVKIDYDGNGAYTNSPPGTAAGSYEVLTYAYDAPGDRITVTAPGVGTETLVRGVDCVRDPVTGACTSTVFSFSSNRLEYDWNTDGVTTMSEIDDAACPNNNLTTFDSACNNVLADTELAALSSVNIAIEITNGDGSSDYYAEAQLRNRR